MESMLVIKKMEKNVTSMMVNIKMIKMQMEKVFIIGMMVTSMMVNGKMIKKWKRYFYFANGDKYDG
jgi:hypothetical protein